ncbi:uncharacterized protein LOC116255050 [Nymphaea colorata]|nr:uncharacterized protein LOC116255050 [Nymphaea colorata]
MGSRNLKDLLTSFSSSAEFLAICSGDGRIKIWDALKGQIQTEFSDITSTASDESNLYTQSEKGHLSLDYRCMKWVTVYKEKKKKKHPTSLLVLGTGSGDVFAFDVSAGQLKWRVNDCHPGGVNAISFSSHNSCLYTAGADGMVCQLDSSTGGLLERFRSSKRAVSSIAVSSDGNVLATAASQIKVFSCLDYRKTQKFSGHPVSVRCMIFSEDSKYIVSSGVGERYVALWKSEGQKEKSACCVLSMDHPSICLDMKGNDLDGLSVLAISEVGVCWLWCGRNVKELQSTIPTKVSVSSSVPEASVLKGQSGSAPAVIAAKLNNSADIETMSVFAAYGSFVRPSFEKILMKRGTDVNLHATIDGVFLPLGISKSVKKKMKHTEVTALDRANAEDAILPIPRLHGFTEKKRGRDKENLSLDLKQAAVIPDRDVRDEFESMDLKDRHGHLKEEGIPTNYMEEKLVSLGILNKSNEHNYDRKTYKRISKGLPFYSSELNEVQGYDNLFIHGAVPLKKIRAAITSMSSADAYKFLKFLTTMLRSRSCSARHVFPWIHCILAVHGRHIIDEEPSHETLDNILEVTQYESSSVQSLLQLSGRLQLLMAQISGSEASKDEVAAVPNHQSVDKNEGEDEDEDEDENGDDDEGEDVDIVQFMSSEDDKSPSDTDVDM